MNNENRKIVLNLAYFFGWSAWFIVLDINIWHMWEWSTPYAVSIGVTFFAVYNQGIWSGILIGSRCTSMWQWWRESRVRAGARKDAVK